ncbi:MAG: nucleotide exchange factor GrpE [Planctomycetota bacterium]
MGQPQDNDAANNEAAETLEARDLASNDEGAQLRAERDKYLEMAKRARADFDNYQKRVSRDLQSERMYASQPLIADLLPVLDNLDRALDSAKGNAEAASIVERGANGPQAIPRRVRKARRPLHHARRHPLRSQHP